MNMEDLSPEQEAAAREMYKTLDAAHLLAFSRYTDSPFNRIALSSKLITDGINLMLSIIGDEHTEQIVSDCLAKAIRNFKAGTPEGGPVVVPFKPKPK